MSWVTIIWSVGSGACLTLALIQFAVWWKDRAARANVVFSVGAIAVAIFAALELALMRADTPQQFGRIAWWIHIPAWFIVASLVAFVRLYLKAGRKWLGYTVVGVRTLSLILNFALSPSLNYRQITALRHIRFLGESVSVAVGVPNPWMSVAQFSLLLLLIFVTDATISVWRRGERRQAIIVGGSIVLVVVTGTSQAVLYTWGIISMPLTVSLFYQALIVAMAYELSYDVLRAAALARQLRTSQARWNESEQRFRVLADSAPVMLWMSGVDKLCTFFNKPWLEFTGRTIAQEMGMGWAEGVYPNDLEKCLRTYTRAFDAREPFVMQYRLRRYDGEYRWISDKGVPRYDPQGKFVGYIGSCVDVTELISKEQALHESKERVDLATKAAGLIVWTWDIARDDVWLSDKDRALFGFSAEEKLNAERIRSVVHPEDRQLVRRLVENSLTTEEEIEAKYRIVLADGSVRWVTRRGRVEFGTDGKPAWERGVLMDITEQTQAQEKFRLAVEASPSGIVLVDREGKIVLVNTHVEKLFGYRRDELIGKPVELLVPERFTSRHPKYRADFVAAPETRAMGAGRDLFAHRKDGSEFPVEIGLNPIHTPEGLLVLANVVDITERKQAEEKFRLAVEASPSGIVLVNREGNIALVNTQTERMFGYDRNELIGKPVEILVPERFGTGHPAYRANFFAAPQTRPMGAGRELFARRKDGSEFRVEIGLNPIQTEQGIVILANVVDISARLAAEEQTRRSREQVELLSRASLLGEMAASLAHELNQPLAAIMNNASAAMENIEQGRLNAKQLQEILTDVMGDGRRAFNIVRDVRSAIKKGTAIRGQINLNDVVKSVGHMVQPDAAANFCKVEMSLAPDLPAIEGDPTQIQQVLINLVRNAFDAMGEAPASQRVVQIITNSNGDGTISVAVRDHGGGIAETARGRLFEHFFTTKKEGLGMGLAIVLSIIEAHGGTVAAENAPGGGARFQFRLPVKKEGTQR